jgi:hypothetical protein
MEYLNLKHLNNRNFLFAATDIMAILYEVLNNLATDKLQGVTDMV